MATRMDVVQTGPYLVAANNSPSPMVQVTGLGGQPLYPFIDIGPDANSVGGVTVLQAIGWRQRGTQTVQLATVPITADGAYEFVTGGLPLWFSLVAGMNIAVTGTPGGPAPQPLLNPITLFVFPDMPPTANDPTVNLSDGIVLDAIPLNYPPDLSELYEMAQDEPA